MLTRDAEKLAAAGMPVHGGSDLGRHTASRERRGRGGGGVIASESCNNTRDAEPS
jgi:hypothetical protein